MSLENVQSKSMSSQLAAAKAAFALQYTALILIILTFTIGAFLKPSKTQAKEASAVLVSANPVEVDAIPKTYIERELGNFRYDAVFEAGTSKFDGEEFSALKEFLHNHDVRADLSLFYDPSGIEAEQGAALALARSVSLYRYFISEGIPSHAVSIKVRARGIEQAELFARIVALDERRYD